MGPMGQVVAMQEVAVRRLQLLVRWLLTQQLWRKRSRLRRAWWSLVRL